MEPVILAVLVYAALNYLTRALSTLFSYTEETRKEDVSDVYIDERGYQRYRHSGQLVHRAVMERRFGRKLRPEEVVHHKDRDKQNNHPNNLWVFKNQAEHDAQHQRDAQKYGEYWSYNGSRR